MQPELIIVRLIRKKLVSGTCPLELKSFMCYQITPAFKKKSRLQLVVEVGRKPQTQTAEVDFDIVKSV